MSSHARKRWVAGYPALSAAARKDIGDVANPGLVKQGVRELPVEYIAGDSHHVLAVRRMNEFAPPNRPQAMEPHQGAHWQRTRRVRPSVSCVRLRRRSSLRG